MPAYPTVWEESSKESETTICHRDYREFDSVNVAVFKDRVEIRSPGLLYGGLTIEAIRTKMVSERRNELIAEMLHRVHFIEKWGRGIKLILSKEPDTKFSEVGTKFITTFIRKSYYNETRGVENTTREKVVEKVVEKLTSNRQKILDYMRQNKTTSAKELSGLVGISQRKIQENILWLREKGLIKRIGPDKGGYWEVVRK